MQTEKKTPLKILEETSRTFYIPIVKLKPIVQQAVASAYLCLRAIDEVEDHPKLQNHIKAKILQNISYSLQTFTLDHKVEDILFNWEGQEKLLPEVTLRLSQWIFYCPSDFRGRVVDCTATMADRMANWALKNWKIDSKEDLDAYTFAVAGSVGLILSQIWEWFQGQKTNRNFAISYGRGLQSVNILRNGHEDAERGVSFYPPGWTRADMIQYSKKNLLVAQQYVKNLRIQTAARTFSQIPLALALATIGIIENGLPKLSRQQVLQICKITV